MEGLDTLLNVYDYLLSGANPAVVGEMKLLFYNLITNKVSYQEAKLKSISLVGVSDPIDRLYSLLLVPDEPLPTRHSSRKYSSSRGSNSWNKIEDQRLLAGIRRYGLSEFKKISVFVGNGRNRGQCSQRWHRSLNPLINKTTWTQEEDLLLIEAVNRVGNHCWSKVAQEFNGSTDVQCRYRYQLISKKYPEDLGIKPSEYFNKYYLKRPPDAKRNASPAKAAPPAQKETASNQNDSAIEFDSIVDAFQLLDLIKVSNSDPSSLFNTFEELIK
ncbi:Myb-like DNA-binding domain containing protein [Trichomonas vaginalis G3]|uniref:Myb-like DNA-binding domain containing protein n=1 Tax=Trichomonas vaginalis (strain ATCC PRA-98 / G3) TaxID=412133 RepID=A2FDE6_TRIV3|nr:RNA polymerase II transcription regulator recruiting protein [Trichomonas vaginalis G3]EAX97060.1 Myb-like DNA-binding domain containing protein [Trichomonas vaginalis G3]KAI5507968.1 RNA polymerase II transcription regulator recruiting protein [Trichomonas vaginalis G3]|eukprot:XP_001309990.1 Myb-like DNA-binding domain containing protein [Trichomonas vaginalis G3]